MRVSGKRALAEVVNPTRSCDAVQRDYRANRFDHDPLHRAGDAAWAAALAVGITECLSGDRWQAGGVLVTQSVEPWTVLFGD
jgi:hypothetical protein